MAWPSALRRALKGLFSNWGAVLLEGTLTPDAVIVHFQNTTNHEVVVRDVNLAALFRTIPCDPKNPELWGRFTLGPRARRSITYPLPEGIDCVAISVVLQGLAVALLDVPPGCSK